MAILVHLGRGRELFDPVDGAEVPSLEEGVVSLGGPRGVRKFLD